MTEAHTGQAPPAGGEVYEALAATAEKIEKALAKEGAGLDLAVDEQSHTVVATLVRHRITCEGCLLPEDLVRTMLRKALKAKRLSYTIETKNWLS